MAVTLSSHLAFSPSLFSFFAFLVWFRIIFLVENFHHTRLVFVFSSSLPTNKRRKKKKTRLSYINVAASSNKRPPCAFSFAFYTFPIDWLGFVVVGVVVCRVGWLGFYSFCCCTTNLFLNSAKSTRLSNRRPTAKKPRWSKGSIAVHIVGQSVWKNLSEPKEKILPLFLACVLLLVECSLWNDDWGSSTAHRP